VLVASGPPGRHGGAIDALVRALVGREPSPRAATVYGPRTDPAETERLLVAMARSWPASVVVRDGVGSPTGRPR